MLCKRIQSDVDTDNIQAPLAIFKSRKSARLTISNRFAISLNSLFIGSLQAIHPIMADKIVPILAIYPINRPVLLGLYKVVEFV